MPEQLLNLILPTGGSAAVVLGIVAYMWKQRDRKDEELEKRLRKQELKCEGTSNTVLTRLDGLAEDVSDVKKDVRFLAERARNGGDRAGK